MSMPQKLNSKVQIIIFICLLFVFNQAVAVSPVSLYEVDALVVDESVSERRRAFKEGLGEVFVRISGDSIVMDKIKAPVANRYIKQYSYDPVETPVTNENGVTLNYRLKIQYNGHSMEKYLLDNGFPVWGEHRSDVVVWLAVRDGRNEYVLKDSDQSLIKTAADEALQRRGIPDLWPIYDYKDRKILSVADIRGGFKDPVIKASARYGRGPALAGSIIWNGKLWQSSWSLLMGGNDASSNRHWSIEDADYGRLINKAIDQAADAMGVVFAIHNADKSQQVAAVNIAIQAVNSIEKYRKIENYLSGLRAVAMAKPLVIDGQSAVFQVTLRSTEADFLNLIKNDAEIVETQALKSAGDSQNNMRSDILQPDIMQPAPENSQPAGVDLSADLSTVETGMDNTDALLDKKKQIVTYHYKLPN